MLQEHLPNRPGNKLTKGHSEDLIRFHRPKTHAIAELEGPLGVIGPSPLIFRMKELTAHFTKTSQYASFLTGLSLLCPSAQSECLCRRPRALFVSQHGQLESMQHTVTQAQEGCCQAAPPRGAPPWWPGLWSWVTSGKSDNMEASVPSHIKWE